ncbi:hypothetical protein [Chromobacterium haemolyticum]|uniref:hypothetical protein n=1 Tax=Chromobacterium haemolyticum TaxID=394935 RepID=UPI002446FD9E|nr:hypothetical protein [Chromobacterium haemolyticum]MDH0342077.1 hypothetical protein [Chromobacterium haemolyticum]
MAHLWNLMIVVGTILFFGGLYATTVRATNLWSEAHISHMGGHVDQFDEKSKRARKIHRQGQILTAIGAMIVATWAIYFFHVKL